MGWNTPQTVLHHIVFTLQAPRCSVSPLQYRLKNVCVYECVQTYQYQPHSSWCVWRPRWWSPAPVWTVQGGWRGMQGSSESSQLGVDRRSESCAPGTPQSSERKDQKESYLCCKTRCLQTFSAVTHSACFRLSFTLWRSITHISFICFPDLKAMRFSRSEKCRWCIIPFVCPGDTTQCNKDRRRDLSICHREDHSQYISKQLSDNRSCMKIDDQGGSCFKVS